jgi:KUP system potassium uptake protein
MLMSTWKTGRQIPGARLRDGLPLDEFPRTAASTPDRAGLGDSRPAAARRPAHAAAQPPSQQGPTPVVLLTGDRGDPGGAGRGAWHRPLGSGFYRVTLRYGFVEEPDVPAAIALARGRGLPIDKDDITYFLGRETLLAAATASGMAQWREGLFSLMSKNAMRATAFFRIPPERVVELGMHVEL